jgi:hypothetical protein
MAAKRLVLFLLITCFGASMYFWKIAGCLTGYFSGSLISFLGLSLSFLVMSPGFG